MILEIAVGVALAPFVFVGFALGLWAVVHGVRAVLQGLWWCCGVIWWARLGLVVLAVLAVALPALGWLVARGGPVAWVIQGVVVLIFVAAAVDQLWPVIRSLRSDYPRR